MITPKIEANNIREAVKELNGLDKTLVKGLRKDLRASISPFAKQIAGAIPSQPPLSGMGQYGPTGWGPVRPSISVTPGRSRKSGDHLVSIRINPTRKQRGLYLGELAGSRSRGQTSSGRRLISNLNQRFPMKGKGGRFAYNKFRLLRPDAVSLAVVIVNRVIGQVNRRIEL